MTDEAAARPSDDDPAVAACGRGDVTTAVVSMSARHQAGDDAAYLEWHVLDHLPEQYRLDGLRLGQRFVSTPACRAARAASVEPFDAVDHIVQYLFAGPMERSLDPFFTLGGALRQAGRMPIGLPRVQVGGWDVDRTAAAERALVGAAVVPWRPAAGAYIVVERVDPGVGLDDHLAALTSVDGVAGVWRYSGVEGRHLRLESTAGLILTVCYLDGPPVEVAAAVGAVLRSRWAERAVTPLLAGPFHAVVPFEWDRHLP